MKTSIVPLLSVTKNLARNSLFVLDVVCSLQGKAGVEERLGREERV